MANKGRVLQFDEARGYGFIAPEEGGADVFFHVNDFDADEALLAPGVRVEFDAMEGGRGKKAYSVRIGDGETETGGADEMVTVGVKPVSGTPRPASDDDGLCDVLTNEELRLELTETFLANSPELTGAQIVRLREDVLLLARKHGWVDE